MPHAALCIAILANKRHSCRQFSTEKAAKIYLGEIACNFLNVCARDRAGPRQKFPGCAQRQRIYDERDREEKKRIVKEKWHREKNKSVRRMRATRAETAMQKLFHNLSLRCCCSWRPFSTQCEWWMRFERNAKCLSTIGSCRLCSIGWCFRFSHFFPCLARATGRGERMQISCLASIQHSSGTPSAVAESSRMYGFGHFVCSSRTFLASDECFSALSLGQSVGGNISALIMQVFENECWKNDESCILRLSEFNTPDFRSWREKNMSLKVRFSCSRRNDDDLDETRKETSKYFLTSAITNKVRRRTYFSTCPSLIRHKHERMRPQASLWREELNAEKTNDNV